MLSKIFSSKIWVYYQLESKGSNAPFDVFPYGFDVCGMTDLTDGRCAFGYRCVDTEDHYRDCCFCTTVQELGEIPTDLNSYPSIEPNEEKIHTWVCDNS